MVPERKLAPVLAATEYDNVPLPVPLPPEVIVIQGASFTVAVQGQPLAAVISMVPVPPLGAICKLEGESCTMKLLLIRFLSVS